MPQPHPQSFTKAAGIGSRGTPDGQQLRPGLGLFKAVVSLRDVEANHHWSGVDLRRVVFSVCCLGRARLLNIRRGPGATRAPFELTKALCGVELLKVVKVGTEAAPSPAEGALAVVK